MKILYPIFAGIFAATGGFSTKLIFSEDFFFESKYTNLILSSLLGVILMLIFEVIRVKLFVRALNLYSAGLATLMAFLGNITYTFIIESYYIGFLNKKKILGLFCIFLGILFIRKKSMQNKKKDN